MGVIKKLVCMCIPKLIWSRIFYCVKIKREIS